MLCETGERSIQEKPDTNAIPVISQQQQQQQQATMSMKMPDQPMNNPRFNSIPTMPPMNFPPMFSPFPGGFDPRFSIPMAIQDPRLQNLAVPRPDWVEMILIYGDGSFHRTIKDHSPMVIKFCRHVDIMVYIYFVFQNMGHMSDNGAPMVMDPQRRPTLDFSQPKVPTPPTIVASTERSSRSRRAAVLLS